MQLKKMIIPVLAALLFTAGCGKEKPVQEPVNKDIELVEIPTDSVSENMEEDVSENEVSVSSNEVKEYHLKIAGDTETSEVTYGIDVSKYQGTIDWEKVSDEGVSFAMIRVGSRSHSDGTILSDTNAKFNMQEALANGIRVGVYFSSAAVSKEEAIEEADWVVDFISQYAITYPVVYDCEGFDNPGNRQYDLTKEERTEIAKAFMDEVFSFGYTPMFYGSKKELSYDQSWVTSSLEESYKIWLALYTEGEVDDTTIPKYEGNFCMWQYSNTGKVLGISTNVDLNIAYFGYSKDAKAKDETAPEKAFSDAEALMNFTEVYEEVTSKSETNLRDIPSQGEDGKVLATLVNQEIAIRTGISDSGWSRLSYNGKTYYAVSSLLTTDLSAPKPEEPKEPDNGIKTKFTDCDDNITAKEAVNLRTLPSVTNEQSQVAYTLQNGETVHRTGYNDEYGWSRVEWNGQVLYCITSYTNVVQ